MATTLQLIDQAWAEFLQTEKPGTWFASHRAVTGHWRNGEDLTNQAIASTAGDYETVDKYLYAAFATLLKTTKPGTWYAKNLGAPGYWTNAKGLFDKARAGAGASPAPKPKSVTIDASAKPTLKAVVTY